MHQRLTTDSVEPHRRLDFWRSSLSELYAPLEVQDCGLDGFRSEISSTQVDTINVARFEGVAQTIARHKPLIRSGDCDDYVAVVQLDGTVRHATNGRDAVTKAGSITLYDLARPYELHALGTTSFIDVSVSRTVLEGSFGPVGGAVGTTVDTDHADAPILVAYFKSLADQGHLLDKSAASRMSAVGVDLLIGAFASRLAKEPARSVSSAAHLYRAQTFIDAHLAEPDLGALTIANELGMSVRRLYAIFGEHDLTIDAYIWDRRLERARRQLRDPVCAGMPIAVIGYQVGFADPAHFARRFKLRFSMTPSEAREQAESERSHQDSVNRG